MLDIWRRHQPYRFFHYGVCGDRDPGNPSIFPWFSITGWAASACVKGILDSQSRVCKPQIVSSQLSTELTVVTLHPLHLLPLSCDSRSSVATHPSLTEWAVRSITQSNQATQERALRVILRYLIWLSDAPHRPTRLKGGGWPPSCVNHSSTAGGARDGAWLEGAVPGEYGE